MCLPISVYRKIMLVFTIYLVFVQFDKSRSPKKKSKFFYLVLIPPILLSISTVLFSISKCWPKLSPNFNCF
ncbi:hypothetical protein EDC94DRAFT_629960 [Helicostylum pulchrum]|nr:hypothetical protein EDC94DRAFT_629960 [Helicostylum pulchrum]